MMFTIKPIKYELVIADIMFSGDLAFQFELCMSMCVELLTAGGLEDILEPTGYLDSLLAWP